MEETEIKKLSVLRLAGESKSIAEDIVAREFPLTIILNNQELSWVQAVHPTATKLYNAAYAGGDYVKIAEAVGFHAERVDKPEGIAPAIERAKKVVTNGQSALIDIIGRMDMDFCSYKELLR